MSESSIAIDAPPKLTPFDLDPGAPWVQEEAGSLAAASFEEFQQEFRESEQFFDRIDVPRASAPNIPGPEEVQSVLVERAERFRAREEAVAEEMIGRNEKSQVLPRVASCVRGFPPADGERSYVIPAGVVGIPLVSTDRRIGYCSSTVALSAAGFVYASSGVGEWVFSGSSGDATFRALASIYSTALGGGVGFGYATAKIGTRVYDWSERRSFSASETVNDLSIVFIGGGNSSKSRVIFTPEVTAPIKSNRWYYVETGVESISGAGGVLGLGASCSAFTRRWEICV